ncbi:MAG: hypothetical protein KAJ19_08425 [Gammaproteobacteria bacterium]|nr:hypothetical protein [Gammaproteobacteria bacterium]
MTVADWSDMMPHTITHLETTGYDDYGAKNTGSPATYKARIIYKNDTILDANGREVISKGHMWIMGTPTIDNEDVITLPDGSIPEILSVETYPDENGAHHVKVFFR